MTIPRASLLLTALGLLAVATLPAASPATQPNVLVIISDDQSWADYGFMGHPHIATPALDQLAAEMPGLKVVKLNTDEEPEVAGAYAIRSIPAVKLFRDGKVVDEFVGAQPLGAVRQFVEPHLPKPSDEPLAAARAARTAGRPQEALTLLEPLHASDPQSEAVTVEYSAALAMTGRPQDAETLLRGLRPAAQSEAAVRAVYALVYFAQLAGSPDETDAIQSARVSAARYLLRTDHARGLETLFAAAERNRRRPLLLPPWVLQGARHDGRQTLL
jgi:thioredoxin-like negative regulator of GroEL